jgi:hypothetical protein
MAPPRPVWRQVFDLAERAVTPHLESLVRTDHFARGAAIATKAQTYARDQVNGLSARLWHLVNLPAATDLARLRAQVGALDREVRRLTLHLERERAHRAEPAPTEETPDAVVAPRNEPRSTNPARPRAPRRRTQRPAGP